MSATLVSFTQRASAGSQAVTGVGFRPKAVILWTTWRAGTGLFDDAEICEGASDGVTQFARTMSEESGDLSASNGMTFGAILRRLDRAGSPGQLCAASLVSLDADGFTLNWSVSDAGGATIHAIALGGGTLRASLITGTLPSGVSTALTGTGFEPAAALVWAAKTGSPTATGSFAARHSWGFAAGADQCSCATLESGAFGNKKRTMCTVTDSIVSTSMQESGILAGGAATHHRIASFDADGLTFEDAAGSFGGTADVAVLCLRGVSVSVGECRIPTSPGTVAVTAGVAPELLLLQTVDLAFGGSPIANDARFGIGAWTEDAQVTLGAGSDGTGQVTASHTDTALRIYAPGATAGASTLRVAATVASIEDDGFTLDCATVTGESTYVQYLAIGPSPASSKRNTLTGTSHTVEGDNNFIAGESNEIVGTDSEVHGKDGTVIGDRSVLFSLDGDPHEIAADGVFEVDANDFVVNGRSLLEAVTGPGASTDRGIASWNGTDGRVLRDTPGPTIASDGRIANVTDPTNPQDVATKAYVDAHSGGGWIPLVDGSEPPNFITDGSGHLILVAYP
jgi:hypothetical protein